MIHRHESLLIRTIEPDIGLLEELLSTSVLSNSNIDSIRSVASTEEQNKQLLRLIGNLDDDVGQNFLTALNKTQQDHFANFLVNNGRR